MASQLRLHLADPCEERGRWPPLSISRKYDGAWYQILSTGVVLVTVATIPALVICPFLSTSRQDMVDRLLARLQEWTTVLAGPRHPCPCQEGQDEDRQ